MQVLQGHEGALTSSKASRTDSSSSGRFLSSLTMFGPDTMTIQWSSSGILKADP